MTRILLVVLGVGVLLTIGGVVAAALAPQLLLVAALLFALLLFVGGVYQIAGPRSRNYRQIKPADMSIGMLGGSWRYPFFYEQKIPTPTTRRKTTPRTATRRTTKKKTTQPKRRGGA